MLDNICSYLTYNHIGKVIVKPFILTSGISPLLFKEIFLVNRDVHKTLFLTITEHQDFFWKNDIIITDFDLIESVIYKFINYSDGLNIKVNKVKNQGELRQLLNQYTVTSKDKRYINVLEISILKSLSLSMFKYNILEDIIYKWVSNFINDTDSDSEIVTSTSTESW